MLNIAKWSKWEFIGAIALEPALLTWKASTELTIVVTIPVSTLTTAIFDAGYISTELGLGHLLVRLEQMSVVSWRVPVASTIPSLHAWETEWQSHFLIHCCLYCYSCAPGLWQPTQGSDNPLQWRSLSVMTSSLHLTKVKNFEASSSALAFHFQRFHFNCPVSGGRCIMFGLQPVMVKVVALEPELAVNQCTDCLNCTFVMQKA